MRAWYVRRVVVVGAESTATTTLARQVADWYDTVWVPEYGRRFCEERGVTELFGWQTQHFLRIATEQLAAEDEAARQSGPILVCDTDALTTSIWHHRYLGHRSPAVEAMAAGRRYALSVLTGDDIPFVQDGTRDGEHLRHSMTRRFRAELDQRPDPWIEVRGDPAARLAAAVVAIDALDGADR